MSALVSISGSKNIKMIQEKIFLSAGDYENILEIYKMYLALYELHFWLQKELQLLRNDITHVSSQKAFLEPIDEINALWTCLFLKLFVIFAGYDFLYSIIAFCWLDFIVFLIYIWNGNKFIKSIFENIIKFLPLMLLK